MSHVQRRHKMHDVESTGNHSDGSNNFQSGSTPVSRASLRLASSPPALEMEPRFYTTVEYGRTKTRTAKARILLFSPAADGAFPVQRPAREVGFRLPVPDAAPRFRV